MKDLVIAVYHKECYAGETALRLEKVFCSVHDAMPYQTNEYVLKAMQLTEIAE